MNKEQLKIKLDALVANEAIKREELGVAISSAQVAREELANAGKPVISESLVVDLVEQIESVFADTIGNIDCSDLSPEFSLNYNEISLDGIDLDNVGIDTDELHTVFEQFFAIKEDDEDEGLISPDVYTHNNRNE
jgi:hypothetical protein